MCLIIQQKVHSQGPNSKAQTKPNLKSQQTQTNQLETSTSYCLVLSCRRITCSETCQVATPMITVMLITGTHVTFKRVVLLIGISVTLILNHFFVTISLLLLGFLWLVVAMLVIFFLVFGLLSCLIKFVSDLNIFCSVNLSVVEGTLVNLPVKN